MNVLLFSVSTKSGHAQAAELLSTLRLRLRGVILPTINKLEQQTIGSYCRSFCRLWPCHQIYALAPAAAHVLIAHTGIMWSVQ
jgi:hypothetical protein